MATGRFAAMGFAAMRSGLVKRRILSFVFASRGKVEAMGIMRRRAGFTLVIVIWGLGVISLLIVSYMTTARERLQAAANMAGATRARFIADGAAAAAIATLIAERSGPTGGAPPPHDGAPHFCTLGGAVAAVAVEDESGKIDLNAAPPKLLATLFAALGAQNADDIARAVVDFRTRPTNKVGADAKAQDPTRPFGPKRALYDTALELDQTAGVDPSLFRAALPLVTVHSRTPGVDPLAAPPALFAALLGYSSADVLALIAAPFPNSLNRQDPRFPGALRLSGARGAALVHAEALLPGGQAAATDTIVDATQTGDAPFSIKETRTAPLRYRDMLRGLTQQGPNLQPDC